MQRNTASLDIQAHSTAPTLKPALSPFTASRLKASLILAYCHEQIDAEVVAMAFAVFGELRAA
jgi:hypothetical protein